MPHPTKDCKIGVLVYYDLRRQNKIKMLISEFLIRNYKSMLRIKCIFSHPICFENDNK